MVSRRKSQLEWAVIKVLEASKEHLSLLQIVEKVRAIDPSLLKGRTPQNSLYSMMYKREKRREEDGESAVFLRHNEGRWVFYSLADKKK